MNDSLILLAIKPYASLMALEGGQESFWEQKRVVPSGVLACCFVGGWLPFKALFRDGLIGDVCFILCAIPMQLWWTSLQVYTRSQLVEQTTPTGRSGGPLVCPHLIGDGYDF